MVTERITAIGFLTDRDLEMLGHGFQRHFPVSNDDMFADLIEQLDKIDVEPLGNAVILRPSTRQ